MFERFDESGKRALVAATAQARRAGHAHLGTEHLLLGVAGLHDDPSGRALASLGLNPDRIRDEILEIIPPQEPSAAADGHLPFTPRVRAVLELADAERTRLGATSVTSSHLLLALVREGEGVAPQVLARLGVGIDDVERALAEPS